jgi:hypothetical protein
MPNPLQQRPVAASLVTYVRSLPVSPGQAGYDINSLVDDLVSNLKAHVTSNVVVVPILQTFNLLLEGDALHQLSDDPRGIERSVLSKNRIYCLNFAMQFTAITFNRDKECREAQKHSKNTGVYEDVRCPLLSLELFLVTNISSSIIHLLSFQPLFELCVLRLTDFLAHEFPSVNIS